LIRDAEHTPGLEVWRGGGDTPSLLANVNFDRFVASQNRAEMPTAATWGK
jgi:hypothetical protein